MTLVLYSEREDRIITLTRYAHGSDIFAYWSPGLDDVAYQHCDRGQLEVFIAGGYEVVGEL